MTKVVIPHPRTGGTVVRLDSAEIRLRRADLVRLTPERPVAEGAGAVLVIDSVAAISLLDSMPQRMPVVVARFELVDASLLDRVRPAHVLFPLIAPEYDALDVLTHLRRLGYAGSIVAVSRPLPDAQMVQRELRSHVPELRFVLLETEA